MKKKFGFTMAELLVSLFIVMVIATAMAPIVGPKKTTPNKQRIAHGVYQAFYDNNGVLHCYRHDSNGESQPAPQDGVCNFVPPKANSYYVTIIGAGGDGSGFDNSGNVRKDFAYYLISDAKDKSGELRTNEHFRADFREAPKVIQQLYEETVKESKYKVDGNDAFRVQYPIRGAAYGPGGNKQTNIIPPYCDNYPSRPLPAECENGLINYGAQGGRAMVGFIQAVLGKDSKVEQKVVGGGWAIPGQKEYEGEESYAQLCVDGKCIKIFPAQRGGDATSILGITEHPTSSEVQDGRVIVSGCNLQVKGSESQTNSSDCVVWPGFRITSGPYASESQGGTNARPLDARVPKSFQYESRNPEIKFYHGYRGEQGQVITKVYGDLQGKNLRLQPALRALDNQRHITYSRLFSIDDNQQKEILNARSGRTGGYDKPKPYGEYSVSYHMQNMPIFPLLGDESIISPEKLNQTITYQTFGLHSLIQRIQEQGVGARVGEGGSGSYPLIFNESPKTSNSITYCINPFKRLEIDGVLKYYYCAKEEFYGNPLYYNTIKKEKVYKINENAIPACQTTMEGTPATAESTYTKYDGSGSKQQFCPAQHGGGGAIIISW